MMSPEPVKFLLVDDIEENLRALEALLRRDGLCLKTEFAYGQQRAFLSGWRSING